MTKEGGKTSEAYYFKLCMQKDSKSFCFFK
ncbi:hypothetical protein IX307_001323 [Bacteroides pyogenes]|nr:hypothetical protein [Bacteroides pyogenes]MBR8707643.1 hypothetical protein [Bacteroides pyogenes]MBR8716730.1 hypothetical protein [Bacteroides pyogenes]MBR8720165.1 hypothetical protein [Bacteroides pyogenes]MBR8724628.1 hypothetical protein [Bacteroides pyogenes]